jgi:hypothetical protein
MASVFMDPGEISGQRQKKLDEAAGRPMVATGIAAAFAAGLAILVSPVSGAFAAAPTVQVDVINPATNPALTSSVDDPGRTAYESNVNCSPVSGGISCQANFSPVPQGHRLVIQHISGGLAFDSDPKLVQVSTKGSPNQGISAFFVPSLVSTSNSLFDQVVLQYFEGGSTPVVEITGLAASFLANFPQDVTMAGYMLKCNAATPCAPIAP